MEQEVHKAESQSHRENNLSSQRASKLVDPLPPETIKLTLDQLRAMIRAAADREGSINAVAIKWGITGQYLGAVLSGHKGPGKKLLRAMGASEIRMYEFKVAVEESEDE